MSLQVWLPLNGNTINYGASNIVATNNGGVVNANGKIGQCYSFGTGASSISLPVSTFKSLSTNFSVSCWVKILSWNTAYSTIWAATSTSASWANIMAGMFRNASTSKILFCIGNNTSSTQSSCITTDDIDLNTWYHCVCTYEPGILRLYQNGVLVSNFSTTIVPAFSTTQIVNIGKMRDDTYQSNSLIDDFRLYDTTLTSVQVQQLFNTAPPIYVKVNNSWKGVSAINIKINGAWKNISLEGRSVNFLNGNL